MTRYVSAQSYNRNHMLTIQTPTHCVPRATLIKGCTVLKFHCEIDLALTYSLRRPKLAIECAFNALRAAIEIRNPRLAYRANELLCAMGVTS